MDNKAFLQIQIYTRKFFRTLKKESIISVFIGVIITILVMTVTRKNMFVYFEGTKSGMFSLICVCVWIGIFNSIQLVCREKNDIVKDELDKSLRASSYMTSHFIYQFILCAVQSIIVFAIFYMYMASKEVDIGSPLCYLVTIFLIMYASDAMAFVISCAVPSPIVAMTVMPLLLLIQLVMAGVLFNLEGISEIIAYFTISKWGMEALGNIGNITDLPSQMEDKFDNAMFAPEGGWIAQKDIDAYEGGLGDAAMVWLILLVFVVAFFFLSVLALKMTTKRIKK